ncbi:hypothetical protein GQ44DRAFT_776742 [Phaeosphaeriaceae sp. PMI808]|nr:hypothetical protein GQ44DRAFT_776742 [Phaeosphaeriaceae sp. PMI808]
MVIKGAASGEARAPRPSHMQSANEGPANIIEKVSGAVQGGKREDDGAYFTTMRAFRGRTRSTARPLVVFPLLVTVLGLKHPDTLTSVYYLAFLFHRQQNYPAALELYQRAYSGYVKALGARHPTTVACFNHYESAVFTLVGIK